MHGPCMFHAWYYVHFMHETCMFMHGTGVFHAWYRHIPCMVEAYSMRGTGVFHAWYCVVFYVRIVYYSLRKMFKSLEQYLRACAVV